MGEQRYGVRPPLARARIGSKYIFFSHPTPLTRAHTQTEENVYWLVRLHFCKYKLSGIITNNEGLIFFEPRTSQLPNYAHYGAFGHHKLFDQADSSQPPRQVVLRGYYPLPIVPIVQLPIAALRNSVHQQQRLNPNHPDDWNTTRGPF